MTYYLRSRNGSASSEKIRYLLLDQFQRRGKEVIKVGDETCQVKTTLATDYSLGSGASTADGIVTTFSSNKEIQLLSLEVNAFDTIESSNIQVYYKEGTWAGMTGDESKWTKLADTTARISPDSKGSIISRSDFQSVTIKPDQEYSLYLHVDQDQTLKVKRIEGTIGQEIKSDGTLSSFSGIQINGGPFGSIGGNMLALEGAFNYEIVQPCADIMTSSEITFEFAIDSNPDKAVMSSLSEIVGKIIAANIDSDTALIELKKEHFLAFNAADVTTDFKGRNDKCPDGYDSCSIINSVATLKHLPTITQGELQMTFLNLIDSIAPPIEAQHETDTTYVGDPVLSASFAFIFDGMEIGNGLNNVQEKYFAKITTDFLSEIPVYSTDVLGTHQNEDANRRKLAYALRDSRHLADSATIIASLYGSGTSTLAFRQKVLDEFNRKPDRFINELTLQHLRPGEINTQNWGSVFNGISSLVISLDTDIIGQDGGNSTSTLSPGSGKKPEEDEGTPMYVYFVIVVLLCAIGYICYRVWGPPSRKGLGTRGTITDNKFQKRTRSTRDQLERAQQLRESLQSNRRLQGYDDDNEGYRRNRRQAGDNDGGGSRCKSAPSGTKRLASSDRSKRIGTSNVLPKNRVGGHSGVSRSMSMDGKPKRGKRPSGRTVSTVGLVPSTSTRSLSKSTRSQSRERPRPPTSSRSFSGERPRLPTSSKDFSGERPRPPPTSRSSSKEMGLGSSSNHSINSFSGLRKSLAGIGKSTRAHLEDLGILQDEVDSDDESLSEGERESESETLSECESESEDEHQLVPQKPRRATSGSALQQMRYTFQQKMDGKNDTSISQNQAIDSGRGVSRSKSMEVVSKTRKSLLGSSRKVSASPICEGPKIISPKSRRIIGALNEASNKLDKEIDDMRNIMITPPRRSQSACGKKKKPASKKKKNMSGVTSDIKKKKTSSTVSTKEAPPGKKSLESPMAKIILPHGV